MHATAMAFWSDESGFLVSAELVVIATILVLGMIVGLSSVQGAMVHQLNNLGWAFSALNQSYFVSGYAGCKGTRTVGSYFLNQRLNAACFVINTGYGGAGFVSNGYAGGYGGWEESTLGIGSASTAAPAPSVAVPQCPAQYSAEYGPDATCPANCPPGTTTVPGLPAPTGTVGPLLAPGAAGGSGYPVVPGYSPDSWK